MNNGYSTKAQEFLQEGINVLTSDHSVIASDPKLFASLMVESVLVNNPDNPNILSEFEPTLMTSLEDFIQETSIDKIPETDKDQLIQDLESALNSRKNSLAKANQVKSLKKSPSGSRR